MSIYPVARSRLRRAARFFPSLLGNTPFTNEGRIWVPGRPYEVPYRCLTPKPDQCDNLLVPLAASFSHVAFCTFRLEPTWMAASHSAGVAATMAAEADTTVQKLDLQALQKRLTAGGQLLRLRGCP